MGTLQDLLKQLTELEPNSSLHLSKARGSLIFPANKPLGKEGHEKVGVSGTIPLSVNYNGALVISKEGNNYRITTTGTVPVRVLAEGIGDWSLEENYVRTIVPDGSDEPSELRIFNTN